MIYDVGYLGRLEDVRWFPYTVEAIRLLNRAGFLVFVTTNQGGIALGYYGEPFVLDLHERMSQVIGAGGGRVDGWFFCPHHPRAEIDALRVDCDCRKPRIGMLQQACERFAVDLEGSLVIGDKLADVEMATNAGARGVLVRTGYGEDVVRAHGGDVPGAAYVAADLMEATSWILGGTSRQAGPA